MKKVVALAIALTMLVGCSSGSSDSGATTQPDVTFEDSNSKIGMTRSESTLAVDQQVIQSASITLRVDDVSTTAEEVSNYVSSIGGRIDSRNEYRDPQSSEITSSDLMVRVPSSQLEDALEQLKTFGDLEGFSSSAYDVTLQVVDLDARIKSLESSIANLQNLLNEATTVTDLLAAESAISQRQAELDSLRSQRTYLADQVDLSAIWVNILPKRALDAVRPIGFIAGIEKGWDAIVDFAGNLSTWAGLALPWIALLIVIGIFFRLLAAVLRRRSS